MSTREEREGVAEDIVSDLFAIEYLTSNDRREVCKLHELMHPWTDTMQHATYSRSVSACNLPCKKHFIPRIQVPVVHRTTTNVSNDRKLSDRSGGAFYAVAFCLMHPSLEIRGIRLRSSSARFHAVDNICRRHVFLDHILRAQMFCTPMARMRNSGGFKLPPKIPSAGPSWSRAVELLGACTQRANITQPVREELIALVGDIPATKEIAQQWKGALTLRRRRELRPKTVGRANLQSRHMDLVKLPHENRHCSYAFILLNSLRRRYDLNIPANAELLATIYNLIGYTPTTAEEVKKVSNALKRLQRARKGAEKNPPSLPETRKDLKYADMLLGQIACNGKTSDRGNNVLLNSIGALPRTKQVARSWQKRVKIADRKRLRIERREKNRQIIVAKRAERSARKLARAADSSNHET